MSCPINWPKMTKKLLYDRSNNGFVPNAKLI